MSNLFRPKSLERISSPEQLNHYIRVATPSVWLVLCAIVVLLAGVCVWSLFGHIDTTLPVVAVAKDGVVTAYVREADGAKVSAGAAVSVDGAEGVVLAVGAELTQVDDSFAAYMCHVGGLQQGEWVYVVTLDAVCDDGVYAAKIIVDSVAPMSFVLN